MLIDIIPLVILALASYRITRFLVIDTLISGLRNKLHIFLVNKAEKENKFLHLVWDKLYDLTSCSWCTGFWVTFLLYWAYTWTSPFSYGRFDFISMFAIAGIQGMLHALEPDND